MHEFTLKVSRKQKIITFAYILFFWMVFIFFAKNNLYFLVIPIAFTVILYHLIKDTVFYISGDKLLFKRGWSSKVIRESDLLDFSFRHSVSARYGTHFHFSVNVESNAISFGSPVPIEECLRFAGILINFFEKSKENIWQATVTTKGDLLRYDGINITINNVLVKKVDFRKAAIVIDPVVLIDNNNKEYVLDLEPQMRDFYIFKSYFDKKIDLEFSFASLW